MSDRDWDLFRDMLEYARDAVDAVGDRNAAALKADRLHYLAACRAVEIVGEAASRVSEAGRLRLPGFPWRDAKNMRNILIHDYGRTEADTVVDTVRNDIPRLIVDLRRILEDAPQ